MLVLLVAAGTVAGLVAVAVVLMAAAGRRDRQGSSADSFDAAAMNTAFSNGTGTVAGRPITFTTVDIGAVNITSGTIVASDPFADFGAPPFSRRVPTGSHRVSLAIARFESGDERVAFAKVSFSREMARNWELAVVEESLAPIARRGSAYGVDTGNGCFMDDAAGALLQDLFQADPDKADEAFRATYAQMESTYRHTRSWGILRPLQTRDENVVCFTSGFGDGVFESYFGLSEAGEVVALVTDFRVFLPSPENR